VLFRSPRFGLLATSYSSSARHQIGARPISPRAVIASRRTKWTDRKSRGSWPRRHRGGHGLHHLTRSSSAAVRPGTSRKILSYGYPTAGIVQSNRGHGGADHVPLAMPAPTSISTTLSPAATHHRGAQHLLLATAFAPNRRRQGRRRETLRALEPRAPGPRLSRWRRRSMDNSDP
jgi:hypothetical protein